MILNLVTFDRSPPRVCRESYPSSFQKACVGGVTTRRFIHDENTVTKDRPRTNFPPKGKRFSFTVVSATEPTNLTSCQTGRHCWYLVFCWIQNSFDVRAIGFDVFLGGGLLFTVVEMMHDEPWVLRRHVELFHTTDLLWYFSVGSAMCSYRVRRCVSINASAPMRI